MFKKGQISIEALIILSVLIIGGVFFASTYLGQRNKLAADNSKILETMDNIDYSGDFDDIITPTPPEPPVNSCLPYPEHCCNDSLDYDEDQQDCGGADCPPCEPIVEFGCDNLGEPVFFPEGGIYNNPVRLSLNYTDESCPDAEIHYTNGENPAEPTMSDPILKFYEYISIPSTTTVKAKVFAIRNGETLFGNTKIQHYDINTNACNQTPGLVIFEPSGTTFNSELKVKLSYKSLSCPLSYYDIIYIIHEDGYSYPEQKYIAPINLTGKDTNITAYVTVKHSDGSFVNGPSKTEIYIYDKNGCDNPIGMPIFNPIGGIYNFPIYLLLSYNGESCSDYNIHYTMNNTEPTIFSPQVGERSINISVDKNITAKVFAKNSLGLKVTGSSKKENYRITAGGSVLCTSGVGGGTGTVTNPKIICTPEELNDIRFDENLSKYYVLGQDIDLNHSILSNLNLSWGYSSTEGWMPIGLESEPFTGSLDGNGYKIKNLYINKPYTDYIGLFGYLGGATPTIKNIELSNANITGNGYVGGIVGVSPNGVSSNLNNIVVTNANIFSSYYNIGGIIGANYAGVLSNSHSTGNIYGEAIVGGLAGLNANLIINSYSNASVSGNNIIGGLTGHTDGDGKIINSYSNGIISGNHNEIGGISGRVRDGNIENSYFSGTVTGTSKVGGISGSITDESKIISTYCTSTATITGTSKVGGIIGNIFLGQSNVSIIEDSNFNGTVRGVSEVGGILGFGTATQSGSNTRTVVNSNLLTGTVTGDSNIGGIAGYSNQTNIEGCKSNGNITGKNNVGGIVGYNSSQIMNSSFSGIITSSGPGNNFGGIAGVNSANYISNSYSKGVINLGSSNNYVGGLIGNCIYAGSQIYNNYSTSQVSGGSNVGGFIGSSNNCSVHKNYSTGVVSGTSNVGGFIGSISNGWYNFNYWNTQTSSQSASAGGSGVIGKTTTEMKQQTTYNGFNFNLADNIWDITENTSYPYLRLNIQNPLPQ